MKGYVKIICALSFLFVIVTGVFFFVAKALPAKASEISKESIVLLNRIAKNAEENKNDLSVFDGEDYGVDFAIIDEANHLLYFHSDDEQYRQGLSVENAMQRRFPYLYLSDGTKVWGAVILLDDAAKAYQALGWWLAAGVCVVCLILLAGMVRYGLYVRKNIVVPFANMKEFAAKVAQGKLDEPLAMDEGNSFGAFTESFDVMREELAASKERELQLQKKEREFVASLSHDLKTPVTGIQVTAELLQMKTDLKLKETADGKVNYAKEELEQLLADAEGIRGKAEQITNLLNDLFTSTLDDLGEFKVNCQDEASGILCDIVRNYDDRGLAEIGKIPAVLICMDKKSMSQVIGNVISNSYKYANTRIDITFRLSERYLEMQISDHGPGVSPEEIDLITNKFYRGKEWAGTDKDGHGLGLYISKTLMNKMKGDLIAESDGKGLAVTLVIPLS